VQPQQAPLAPAALHTQAPQQVMAPLPEALPVEPEPPHSQARYPRAFRNPCKIPDRPPTDFRNFCKIQPCSLPWFGRCLGSGDLRSILTENPGHSHSPYGVRRLGAAFAIAQLWTSDPRSALS
jgi:hypothetical protein